MNRMLHGVLTAIVKSAGAATTLTTLSVVFEEHAESLRHRTHHRDEDAVREFDRLASKLRAIAMNTEV